MIINGHPVEMHTVQTEDGYLLQLIRIPQGQKKFDQNAKINNTLNLKNDTDAPKPAVLVVHGLNSCGSTWLLNSPEKVLPCKLVAEGYDCFIASLRGSKLSRGHITLTTKSKKYWDFSAIEHGLFDIPALIDYILKTTGNSSLYYVGHSMGCSVLFGTVNMRPEYNLKLKLMIALAPAVYGRHVTNSIVRTLSSVGSIMGKYSTIYRQEIFGQTFAELGKKFCPPFRNREKYGVWLMYNIAGRVESIGKEQLEKSRRATVSKHVASSTSMKTGCHIGQCFVSNKFQQYDYGRAGNLKKYGQSTPPIFNLEQVTFPVITFGAVDDKLTPAKDVIQVSKELGNLIEYREIIQKDFTHADFAIGKDADTLVYDPIIQIFENFENDTKSTYL